MISEIRPDEVYNLGAQSNVAVSFESPRRSETFVTRKLTRGLANQAAVRDFMAQEKPDAVILAAAKVGGIHANNAYPAEFIYENLMIECYVIH